MGRGKTSAALFAFLKEQGYLDKGSEHVKLGKKLFRKNYLAQKKREYRAAYTEHTLTFKPNEEKILQAAAAKHNMDITFFIRHAAISYSIKQYLVPRTESMFKIEQQLVYARTQIDRISKEKQGIFGKSKNDKIETVLAELHEAVYTTFRQPRDLEDLLSDALRNTPSFAERVKLILANHVR